MLRPILLSLSALALSGVSFSAEASPITAMSCVNPETKTFVTVGISTGLFAPAAPMRILEYRLTVGKLDGNGEVEKKTDFESESNAKVFDDDSEASEWVSKNVVVVPMTEGSRTLGAVLVDSGKKKVTLVDTDYETAETLDCLRN